MPEENIKSLPASALTAAGQLSPDPHPSSFNPSPTSAHGETVKLPRTKLVKQELNVFPRASISGRQLFYTHFTDEAIGHDV